MKAILIDDEYYALQGLRMELEEIGGVEVVGAFDNSEEALEAIKTLHPRIIFLDIEMPGLNGLELFAKIMETGENPEIVFVTAHGHYAVQAFELHALDYLVKPVQRLRLLKTLERIKKEEKRENGGQIVNINCFRHLAVIVDGVELKIGWRTKKAEELMAFLLCEKGRFVAKEKIAEALWPELEQEKSFSNLYLAYYYLKKLEQKDGIKIPIESVRGRMRIRVEELDCDMASFNRCLESCRTIDDSNIALAERGTGLYSGMLLEDSYYSWVVDHQQYYEIAYTEMLQKIIDYYKKKGNKEKLGIWTEKLKIFAE
jgi:two-component SAPR family response regulator